MSRRTRILAIFGALTVTVGALVLSPAFAADSGVPAYLTDGLAECQAQQRAAVSLQEQAWAETCVVLAQRALDAYVAAHPQPTATPTVTPTATVGATPTAAPTTLPPTTTPPATTPPASGWPGVSNTGVPAGTVLTAYTGPCTITAAGTVIDAKTITCAQLVVKAAGVKVTRSRITGTGDPAVAVSGGDLAITDSTILAATNTTGIGDNNWTATRLNISGGNRGSNCDNHCTLRDSWLHGNRVSGTTHASGLRAGQFTQAIHNTLQCDAPADNCSADLTGYPDFAPTHDWTITGNYFVAQHLGGAYFCSYGGATKGKGYSNDPANAVNIQFRDNTYEHGPGGWCGGYKDGSPISDYDTSRPGWVWSGNVWSSGEALTL